MLLLWTSCTYMRSHNVQSSISIRMSVSWHSAHCVAAQLHILLLFFPQNGNNFLFHSFSRWKQLFYTLRSNFEAAWNPVSATQFIWIIHAVNFHWIFQSHASFQRTGSGHGTRCCPEIRKIVSSCRTKHSSVIDDNSVIHFNIYR